VAGLFFFLTWDGIGDWDGDGMGMWTLDLLTGCRLDSCTVRTPYVTQAQACTDSTYCSTYVVQYGVVVQYRGSDKHPNGLLCTTYVVRCTSNVMASRSREREQ